MTREQHLERCKQRAREYLDRGDLTNAVASMASDLQDHPETRDYDRTLLPLALVYIQHGDLDGVRRWIEGFR